MQSACRCRPLPILPAVLLVLLPKCPLCLGAWFGLFGALGVGSWIAGVWGVPLGAALLAITLSALAVRAFRTRDLRPLPVGLLGAGVLLAGKQFDDVFLLCAGGCLLLLASAIRPRARGGAPVKNRVSIKKNDSYPFSRA
ncbi:MAG TPA: hypothetical protein VHD76_03600 [Bryobacteraceae bacterium]|jgi:hypothetical protein|nr:hypothetical protein [Bryobacteraceae bacterium]